MDAVENRRRTSKSMQEIFHSWRVMVLPTCGDLGKSSTALPLPARAIPLPLVGSVVVHTAPRNFVSQFIVVVDITCACPEPFRWPSQYWRARGMNKHTPSSTVFQPPRFTCCFLVFCIHSFTRTLYHSCIAPPTYPLNIALLPASFSVLRGLCVGCYRWQRSIDRTSAWRQPWPRMRFPSR